MHDAATPSELTIYVGSVRSDGNFASSYTECAAAAGPISANTQVPCDSPVTGRYLAIQMAGSSKQLAMCEVNVYTSQGTSALIII